MSRIKNTMLMKTQSTFINRPGWGICFMIDGHKFYAREGSDLCDLIRSIIMYPIEDIKKTVDRRHIMDNVVYNKANELCLKRTEGPIFDVKTLFDADIEKEKQEINNKLNQKPTSKPDVKETKPVSDIIKSVEEKKPEKKTYVTKKVREEIKKNPKKAKVSETNMVVDIISELKLLKTNDIMKDIEKSNKKPVSKTVVKEEVKVEQPIVKETVNEIKNPEFTILQTANKVEVITEEDNKVSETVKEEVKVKSTSLETVVSVFKEYEKVLNTLNISKLKRDDARKYKIHYAKYSDNNYTKFLEMYDEWKAQNY